MLMFLTFKLSFNVDILTFLANFSKIGQNFKQFSGHTACHHRREVVRWQVSARPEVWKSIQSFQKLTTTFQFKLFQATTTTRCLHLPQDEEITELNKVAAASSASPLFLTYYRSDATRCPSFSCRRRNWPKIWPLAPDSQETFIYDKVSLFAKMPNQWKLAKIIPLHKKDKKNNPENCRLISLLCSLGKVYEKCFLNVMTTTFGDSLPSSFQHGFRKNRSTTTAALTVQNSIAKALDKKEESHCSIDWDICSLWFVRQGSFSALHEKAGNTSNPVQNLWWLPQQ
jgi:hypothetical protein